MSMQPSRESPGRVPGPRRAPVLIGVGVVSVGLAAVAGGALWLPRENSVDKSNALMRGSVAALITLGVVLGVLAVARGMGWLRVAWLQRSLLVAGALVLVAFAALAGIATAEDDPEEASPPDLRDLDLNAPPSLPAAPGTAFQVDNDGDGLPDRAADGSVVLVLDRDGDGVADVQLVPCPDRPDSVDVDPGEGRVVLDLNCDGAIDGTITLDPELVRARPGDEIVPSELDIRDLDVNELDPDDIDDRERQDDLDDPSDENDTDAPPDEVEDAGGDESSWSSILTTIAIVVGLAVALLVASAVARSLRNRARGDETEIAEEAAIEAEPEIDDEAVDAAIESSIETLLGHPDPRIAVTAAYAVLLDALAEAGFGRLSYETPQAHLARCLLGLRVAPRPMRELLVLFEIAKFSNHPVGESERQRALAALRSSQDQLRARNLASADATGWAPPGGVAR
ncbi:MAG: DUF4129 domain-containing protein [Ilumatobacteraceae bacterium]